MKDEILQTISMKQILDRYGIINNNNMFKCPFHGEDRHPSAKAYENSYHCFCCQNSGDTIRFVENLFNLSFKEAMQKINLDFNLGLNPNVPIDYEKLNQIKSEQYERQKVKEKRTKKYCELCDLKHYYEKIIEHCTKRVNIKNWEKLTHTIGYLQNKIFQVECEIELLDNKISTRT